MCQIQLSEGFLQVVHQIRNKLDDRGQLMCYNLIFF